LILDPSLVPEEWQDRATLTALVRLLPDEAAAVVGRADVVPGPDEAEFLALVASGLSAEAIARRVHSAPRSVYRRLARLRAHFGVESTAELVAELSRRGY
jgi:DNA-binding CsgD family transcriptional regulator